MKSYEYLSKIYDELMADVPYDKWIDYIVSFLDDYKSNKKSSILEIGCGTGNVAIDLKKRGYEITGLDVSHEMLLIAEENARKAGVNIPFICQDISEAKILKNVDIALSVCDVINYIAPEKLKKSFKMIYDLLKPKGVFLFDISSPYKLKHILGDNIFFEDLENMTYIWVNELEKDRVKMDITIFLKENDLFRRSDESHLQYIHDEKTIMNILNQCGFKFIKVYDCFSKNDIEEKSERFQFLAKKA